MANTNYSNFTYADTLAAAEKAAQRRLNDYQSDKLDREEASRVLDVVARQRSYSRDSVAPQCAVSFEDRLSSAKKRTTRWQGYTQQGRDLSRE